MKRITVPGRGLAVAAGVAALVVGGAVAAVGVDGPDPSSIDPAQAEVTITDETSTLDGTPTGTNVATYDVEGHLLDRQVSEP